MLVRNEVRSAWMASRCQAAGDLLSRAIGLMGRKSWEACDGLLLERCNSVHTFFMRMPIDVVYLDKSGTVIRTASEMRPWRIGPIVWGAASVLELPAGTIERTGTAAGDRLLSYSR